MATATRVNDKRQINLRLNGRQQILIDKAAERLGKTRTDFMLDVTTREAEDVLLDHSLFVYDDETYNRFVEILDAPASATDYLKALLKRPAPWE